MVSFIGSLQPGLINLNTFRIASQHGKQQALLFSLGAVIAEIVFASLSILLYQVISISEKFNSVFTLIGVIVFFAFGIQLLFKNSKKVDTEIKISNKKAFFHSITLSLLNPGLLFFWIATTGIAIGLGYELQDNIINILSFVLGAGMGVLCLLLLVVLLAIRIKKSSTLLNINLLNKISGVIFLLLAIVGLIKLFL